MIMTVGSEARRLLRQADDDGDAEDGDGRCPAAFRTSSLSFMISQSSSTAKGIWICRMRLAAVAGIASLRRPQNSSAPWMVTAKAEMAMMEGPGVFSLSRWVSAQHHARCRHRPSAS